MARVDNTMGYDKDDEDFEVGFDRQDIFDEIDVEREFQDKIYGAEHDDECNDLNDWVAYITRYSAMWFLPGEIYMQHSDKLMKEFRIGMIKVAALAVAAIESTDRELLERRNEDG